MKFLKKLLVAAGVAGALLSAPASANLQLRILDALGNPLINNGPNAIQANTNTGIALFGTINGWTFNLVGFTSTNPAIGMSIKGSIQHTGAADSAFLINLTDPTGIGNGGIGTYSLNSTANTQGIKIRFSDTQYPLPGGASPSLITVSDSLTQSNNSLNTNARVQLGIEASNPVLPADQFSPCWLNCGGGGVYVANTPATQIPQQFWTFSTNGSGPGGTFGLTMGIDLFSALQPNAFDYFDIVNTVQAQASIPEPGTLGLLGLSLIGLAALNRRRLKA